MTLVDRSPDLARLVEEGYDVEVRGGNLFVHHVPYATSEGNVSHCVLVSEFSHNGTQAITPANHQISVVGGVPHDHQGEPISIILNREPVDFGHGFVASCELSGKHHGEPPSNYYEKVTNYVNVLGYFARSLDASATHRDYPVRESMDDTSPFRYQDSWTSRAKINALSVKLEAEKVAIVGLGGTGSYVLDLLAKTPIAEIHLYDDDVFAAHNAFRAPGAASISDLAEDPSKVEYFARMYDPLRRGVVPHAARVTLANIEELRDADFVFLTMDSGPAKREIVASLTAWGVGFIDCGMGVRRQNNALRGTLRVTASVPGHSDHLDHRITYTNVEADDYDDNIQSADLNMLNAVMAVVKWKKLRGYYADDSRELNATYVVSRNRIHSGDGPW